ncbi:sulfite exporter TauE/SafE family protein [Endothiovibrio diazotrophicus]
MDYLFGLAFLVGLSSTPHCFGMCGGITGALTVCLPAEARERKHRLLPFLAAYNSGRIASYIAAGAIAGSLGGASSVALGDATAHLLLRAFAAAVLISVGLHLAGWLPGLSALERLGAPLWRRLSPLGRKLLPVTTSLRALAYGVVWGWLPCGVVYSGLLAAAGTGSAASGALFMLAFGLGTLPGLFTMGLFSGWLIGMGRDPRLRRAVGIAIIAATLVGVVFAPEGGLIGGAD